MIFRGVSSKEQYKYRLGLRLNYISVCLSHSTPRLFKVSKFTEVITGCRTEIFLNKYKK